MINQRAPIQSKVLMILQDGDWWETALIKKKFGCPTGNSKVHMALTRLVKKGLVITKRPPAFGNPPRYWKLNPELNP